MDAMLHNVRVFIEENRLIREGDLVLCAVSGGVDSMVLLDILHRLSAEKGFFLHIAHFDHCLRGSESVLDGELVKMAATSRGLPFSRGSGDVKEYMRQGGPGLEEAARLLRYRFLFQLKQRIDANKLATAHHADDQVETILMRLMRGTGLRGLTGIKAIDDRGLIRPFLSLKKQEIIEYSSCHAIMYREDSTNRHSNTLRNHIRNDVLSSISGHQRVHLADNIYSLCNSVNELVEYIEETVRKLYVKSLLFSDAKEIKLDLEKMRGYHYFLRKELLRYSYKILNGGKRELSRGASDFLSLFCQSAQSGKIVQLPGGITACINFNTISLIRKCGTVHESPPASILIEPGIETKYPIGSLLYKVSVKQENVVDRSGIVESVQAEGGKHLSYFDIEKLHFPLKLRSWMRGDRISPFGFVGTKKVSDLLQEARVPRQARESIPVLTDRARLLWVIGVRRSSHATVEAATRHTLVIKIQQEDWKNAE